MAQFAIEHLSEDRLAEAWPVIRQSDLHANVDWWISEGSALIQRGGGIIAARGHDRTIHGIATYEVARKALLGRVLRVNALISFELSGRAPVRHALVDALELLANAFDCPCIVLRRTSMDHVQHRASRLYDLTRSGPEPDPD